MTTTTIWYGKLRLDRPGLTACSDDFVAFIKARHATSEMRGTI